MSQLRGLFMFAFILCRQFPLPWYRPLQQLLYMYFKPYSGHLPCIKTQKMCKQTWWHVKCDIWSSKIKNKWQSGFHIDVMPMLLENGSDTYICYPTSNKDCCILKIYPKHKYNPRQPPLVLFCFSMSDTTPKQYTNSQWCDVANIPLLY
jgi:hypothetical protein